MKGKYTLQEGVQACPRGEQLMGFRFSGLIAGVEAEVEYSSG